MSITANFDDADRAAVYAAEDTLSMFDRSETMSDAQAKTLASKHVGQPVEVVRDGRLKSIYGMWITHQGKRLPVLAAPPNYSLSTFEVCHEAAHLITDKAGVERGHGVAFRKMYLSLLPDAIRDHLAAQFQQRGLSVTASSGEVTLYRGLNLRGQFASAESIIEAMEKWSVGSVGSHWSTNREVAEVFARHNLPDGGTSVLLVARGLGKLLADQTSPDWKHWESEHWIERGAQVLLEQVLVERDGQWVVLPFTPRQVTAGINKPTPVSKVKVGDKVRSWIDGKPGSGEGRIITSITPYPENPKRLMLHFDGGATVPPENGYVFIGTPLPSDTPPVYTLSWEHNYGVIEATVDGEVIGALRWDYHADPPVISGITVDERYQRRGIATAMLEHARVHEPRLVHSDTLTDDGKAWSRHVGYQERLIGSRHGNQDCAPHSGSGEVAHRASWRSDVGADQSRRDHHAERDRGRTASQGLPTRQPRLPARVATGDDLPLVGPLKRAWQSYSVDTKNQIKAAYRALLSGKEKPDPKTGSLKGFFTVPVGGSVTTSDKRILLMRVNGQWVAVFFVTDHDYSRAEDEVGAWIEFLHRGKTSAVAMVWAWSDKVAGASGPLPELGYQIVRDDALVTVKAYSEYSPKSVIGALVFDFLTGVVLSISVRPECQRRGVASEMWSRAKAYCPRLQPAGSMAFAKMSAEIVDYKTERPLVGSGGLTFEVTKGQWGVRIQALVNGAAAGALRFYKSNGEIDKIAVLPQYQRQGIATALLAKAREIDPRVHHAKDLTPDGKAWSDKVAGAKGNLPKVIYRWARKDLVMAVRESDGVSIGEMTIGVLDADTLYVASVIAQYKRMGIAQGLLEEVHRVHPTKKIAHAGFYDRQGLNWGREMSKRLPDWNVFSPTIWDKKEFHLATSQDQKFASGVNYGTSDVTGGRKRKPVRRDPLTGIELCHKKVDGFPCKYLMGHAQGCAVDWNAAYPDEEPESEPENKKSSLRTTAGTKAWVKQLADMRKGNGRTLHGDKYDSFDDLIYQEGKQYSKIATPEEFVESGYLRGNFGNCYMNAANLAFDHPELTYVEGYAFGVAFPMNHAWCIDRSGRVFDPTWADGKDYFGVAVPTSFLRSHIGRSEVWGLFAGDPGKRKANWDLLKTGIPKTGAKTTTYFHASPVSLDVGSVLRPADRMRLWGGELRVDDQVYFSTDPWVAAAHVGGATKMYDGKAFMYEVEPVGPILDDPEFAAAGHQGESLMAPSARVVRRYEPAEWMLKQAYTEFRPPADIIIHSGGDAVPDGFNGYFVAYDKSSGKKLGFLDYNSAPGEPVLIAMVDVDPSYRRRGVATVLLAALRHEFPDSIIVPGYTTETGGKWWHSVQYAASKHTTSGAKVQSASERPAHLEQGDSQPVDRGSLDVVAGVPASVTVQKHGTVVLPTGADTPESVTRITAGANGLLPEGLTFGVMPRGSGPTQRISIGAQSVMAEINGQYVGSLFWNAQTGEVEDIWVNDDYYRLGIATAMWQEAKRRDPKIKHSEIQTEDGKEWSQKVAACTTKILASGVKIEA